MEFCTRSQTPSAIRKYSALCAAKYLTLEKVICGTTLSLSRSLEPSYSNYFGGVLLMPGAGHLENNFLMAIFSLCSLVFMGTIAATLGFRSKKAVDFIKNVGDHHLGWQIASIAYEVFSNELIFVYCVESRKLGVDPTPNGLTERRDRIVNLNYHLTFHITFNLPLRMKCFRSRIRKSCYPS